MSNITVIKLLAMINSELKKVDKKILEEKLLRFGSTTKEDSWSHSRIIEDHEELKRILEIMARQIEEEGCINV